MHGRADGEDLAAYAVVDFLAETATEVRTRVRIDPEKRTVVRGQLWFEENLPAESVLWGVLGTDRSRARLAAIFDAMWQETEYRPLIEARLLEPVATRIATEERAKAEETAATRVDFFTMVRGED